MKLSNSPGNSRRFAVIACAVLLRELYHCAAMSKNIIDIIPLDQGLHDLGEKPMSAEIQRTIDSIEHQKHDAILLGYGLCNNGIRGLHAPITTVVPRVHDCIALLMGSRVKFQKYFDDNPGTFYRSAGWIERVTSHLSNPQSTTSLMGMATYEEYAEKYGPENAKYLIETLEGGLKHYEKLTYIDTVPGCFRQYRESSRDEAENNGWKYEAFQGGTDLLQRLLDGSWDDEDFLVLKPGETIQASYDDKVVCAGS
ncbi:MAG: DUF1638 domain-containing protein [Victivallales bacterium]|nr:DUF1638 domain-containing protein [Victivallales bacterium]